MTDTKDLMLVHVEAVVGVVVARAELFAREGLGNLIHAALLTVELNAGHSLLKYQRALKTGQARDGCPVACITWDTQSRAEANPMPWTQPLQHV